MATNRTDRHTSGPSGAHPAGGSVAAAGASATMPSGASASASAGDTSEGGFAQKLKNQASERLVNQKNRAIGELDTIADAIRGTGRSLREQDHGAIAGYVENAADQLHRFSETLQRKEVGEIVEEVQRFGRSRPALFVGLAFGAGLAGARFLKSSGDANEPRTYSDYGTTSTPAGDWRRASSAPSYGAPGDTSAPLPRGGTGSGPADLG
jgi:hypothetical protein